MSAFIEAHPRLWNEDIGVSKLHAAGLRLCRVELGREMAYRKAAEQLGRVMTDRGIGLVYGGARSGLMGTVADAVLGAGGEAIGVIPEALVAKKWRTTGCRRSTWSLQCMSARL